MSSSGKLVTSADIVDGTITAADLASGAVHALTLAAGTTSAPTTTATSAVLIPEMFVDFTPSSSASRFLFLFTGSFHNTTAGGRNIYDLYLDTTMLERQEHTGGAASYPTPVTISYVTGGALTVASHRLEMRWWVAGAGGTAVALSAWRYLYVIELKR